MISVSDYVPILPGRTAEYHALAELDPGVCARVTPLIEVTPLPLDPHTDEPSRSIEAHLVREANVVMECWGFERPVIIDALNVESSHTADLQHPVTYLHEQLDLHDVLSIPATALHRAPEYQAAVAEVARRGSRGVCLRLDRNQWADPAQLAAEIIALLSELGIEAEEVDIVVDLGKVEEDDAKSSVTLVRGALQALPAVHSWRSLVVAASSFPQSVSDAVGAHQARVFRRAEQEMYELLVSRIDLLPRLPTFGDYGIEGASGPAGGVNPRFWNRNISASIRYTGLGGWFITRGGRLREEGYEQYRTLAKQIMDSPHWRGERYCKGDEYIARCARVEVGSGTPKIWRQVAVNHHITSVTDELKELLES